jgi:hypothetical protein
VKLRWDVVDKLYIQIIFSVNLVFFLMQLQNSHGPWISIPYQLQVEHAIVFLRTSSCHVKKIEVQEISIKH